MTPWSRNMIPWSTDPSPRQAGGRNKGSEPYPSLDARSPRCWALREKAGERGTAWGVMMGKQSGKLSPLNGK